MTDLLEPPVGALASAFIADQETEFPEATKDDRIKFLAERFRDLIGEYAADLRGLEASCLRLQVQRAPESGAWSRLGGKASAYGASCDLILQMVT